VQTAARPPGFAVEDVGAARPETELTASMFFGGVRSGGRRRSASPAQIDFCCVTSSPAGSGVAI